MFLHLNFLNFEIPSLYSWSPDEGRIVFRKDKMKIFSPSVKLRLAFCLSLTYYCTIKGEKTEMKSNQPSSGSILLSTWGLFLLTAESSELWWCHHQYPYLNIMGGDAQRRIQNLAKHVRWRFSEKIADVHNFHGCLNMTLDALSHLAPPHFGRPYYYNCSYMAF